MSDSLRNPESVLKALSEHSSDSDYKFERLYRNLFNKQFFYAALPNHICQPWKYDGRNRQEDCGRIYP